MNNQQPSPAVNGYGLGTALCLFGGALCSLGYFVPWVTYHYEGGHLTVMSSGWQAVTNPATIVSTVHGNLLSAVLGAGLAVLFPFVLFMGMLALVVGTRSLLATQPWSSQLVRRLFWAVAVIGTLALPLMIYELDPFGLNSASMWVLARDPAPSVGLGLYMACVGACTIIIGGMLLSRRRSPRPTSQAPA